MSKMSQNLEKPPKISKKSQKCFQREKNVINVEKKFKNLKKAEKIQLNITKKIKNVKKKRKKNQKYRKTGIKPSNISKKR